MYPVAGPLSSSLNYFKNSVGKSSGQAETLRQSQSYSSQQREKGQV